MTHHIHRALSAPKPFESGRIRCVPAPRTIDAVPNRLAGETSPYLLQHANNPVDWMPWGGDALARARLLDRPIFLSIGYAACHWGHVMERESFEDEATARLLNERFVSIKVDREERPDLDSIYMSAVQAMTGGGGWPMSVFLTPDGQPFYGGTYYPNEPRHGLPSFRQVLEGVSQAWMNQTGRSLSLASTFSIETVGVSPTPPERSTTGPELALSSLKAPRGGSISTTAPGSISSWSQQELRPSGTSCDGAASRFTVIRYVPSSRGDEETV